MMGWWLRGFGDAVHSVKKKGWQKPMDDSAIREVDIFMPELARYFEELRVRLGVVDEVKKEVDRLVAPDFNLFSILSVDEVRLSKMIARLLNPYGAHGQGSKFLDAFLDTIKKVNRDVMNDENALSDKTVNVGEFEPPWSGSKMIKVKTEQSTHTIEASQRRMDILISGHDYGLMIENKPWAIDQKDQLVDYERHLKNCFGGNYLMIYLSGDGSPPSGDSFSVLGKQTFDGMVKNGKFMQMAFRPHLTDWLQDCLAVAEPERVRWILKDFITYIENKFPDSISTIQGAK